MTKLIFFFFQRRKGFQRVLQKQGIKFKLNTKVTTASKTSTGIDVK